jgi:choice-of-anchor A domain-containing protein
MITILIFLSLFFGASWSQQQFLCQIELNGFDATPPVVTLNGTNYDLTSNFLVIAYGEVLLFSGDIEGRVAFTGDANFGSGMSIGEGPNAQVDTVCPGANTPQSLPYAILGIGQLSWVSGNLFPDGTTSTPDEYGCAGTVNNQTIPDSTLLARFEPQSPTCVNEWSAELNSSQSYYEQMSTFLAGLTPNTNVEIANSQLTINCTGYSTATQYVTTITDTQLNSVTVVRLATDCNQNAQYIINVLGSNNIYFTGDFFMTSSATFPFANFTYIDDVAGRTVLNIVGSGRTFYTSSMYANVLAPQNNINSTGTIFGQVIADEIELVQVDIPTCTNHNRTFCVTTSEETTAQQTTEAQTTEEQTTYISIPTYQTTDPQTTQAQTTGTQTTQAQTTQAQTTDTQTTQAQTTGTQTTQAQTTQAQTTGTQTTQAQTTQAQTTQAQTTQAQTTQAQTTQAQTTQAQTTQAQTTQAQTTGTQTTQAQTTQAQTTQAQTTQAQTTGTQTTQAQTTGTQTTQAQTTQAQTTRAQTTQAQTTGTQTTQAQTTQQTTATQTTQQRTTEAVAPPTCIEMPWSIAETRTCVNIRVPVDIPLTLPYGGPFECNVDCKLCLTVPAGASISVSAFNYEYNDDCGGFRCGTCTIPFTTEGDECCDQPICLSFNDADCPQRLNRLQEISVLVCPTCIDNILQQAQTVSESLHMKCEAHLCHSC